jgi:hypothetical protein
MLVAVRGGTSILLAVAAFVECNNGLGEDRARTADNSLDDAARIRPGNVGRK